MKKHANVPIFVPHLGCPHACAFCNQRAISGAEQAPAPEDVDRILTAAGESLVENTHSAQIAFFGGSFTAIPREYRLALLKAAQPHLGRNGFSGIRVSTRPDAVDEAVLGELWEYGVRTVELGVQSMDAEVLRANRRGHGAEDVVRASRLIRDMGFELGHQMMTGLYRSTAEKELETGARLAALGPDTMRIYPALVLRGTELAALYSAGAYKPQDSEAAVEVCARLLELFCRAGIRVIRLGLHDDASLAGNVLAGPHHPAFRELCEGRMLLDRVTEEIRKNNIPPGALTIRVNPRAVSKMAGQNRRNLLALANMGYRARLLGDGEIPEPDVMVIPK